VSRRRTHPDTFHVYAIETCGVGTPDGGFCGKPAAFVHLRTDTRLPALRWACPACHRMIEGESKVVERYEAD
jgi:hypothetical protein